MFLEFKSHFIVITPYFEAGNLRLLVLLKLLSFYTRMLILPVTQPIGTVPFATYTALFQLVAICGLFLRFVLCSTSKFCVIGILGLKIRELVLDFYREIFDCFSEAPDSLHLECASPETWPHSIMKSAKTLRMLRLTADSVFLLSVAMSS